jgi:hypothetical protein
MTFAWLLLTRAAQGAAWWMIAVLGCMGLTAITKIWCVRMITVGVCFILGIAVPRVVLGMHGVREVLIGLTIGTAALAVFGQGYLSPTTSHRVAGAICRVGGCTDVDVSG